MTYTKLEVTVFNKLVDICAYCCDADVADLSNETGLSKNTIKGVVGSLVKKDLVVVGEETRERKIFLTINTIIDGEAFAFGCDNQTEEEIENLKLKNKS